MIAAPVAYIRRSVARTNDPGDVSRDFQTEKVRGLANGDGSSLRIVDGDWGRSAGRHKAEHRAAFRAMVADIAAGHVSTLYAYSTDRLARDAESAYGLLNACERAGVTIVTSEGRFPPGDRMARQMFGFAAMQNEAALDAMTDKAGAVASKRRERGDAMGRAPYGYRHEMREGRSVLVPRDDEDPGAVVAAFRATGTYNEAAKLLNGEAGSTVTNDAGDRVIGTGIGLPTRFGRKWDASTVRHVVQREAPTIVPPVKHRGSPAGRSVHRFARLLRCPWAEKHHGTPGSRPFLTVSTAPAYRGKTYGHRYYCAVAHTDPSHPRPYIVAESKVLAWAREAVRDVPRRLEVELAGPEPAAEAKLAALEAKRERVRGLAIAGVLSPERAKAELAAIDAEVPALELGRRAVYTLATSGTFPAFDPGGIDWDADPATINARLRELWQWIELDPKTMEPARAVWTIGNEPLTADQEAEAAALDRERYPN